MAEPCPQDDCLGFGFYFSPLTGKSGNVEELAVKHEAKRQEEAAARELEEQLEQDVRELSGEVEGLRVDAPTRSLPPWLTSPWSLVIAVVVAAVLFIVATSVGSDSSDSPQVRTTPKAQRASPKADRLNQLLGQCKKSDWGACEDAAHRLHDGRGVQPSPIRAQELMQQACTAERASACAAIARWTEAKPSTKNDVAVLQLYRKACDLGDHGACADVAERVRDTGESMSTALALAQRACQKGSSKGCYILASMLFRGEGCEADEARAEANYRLACDEDYGDACNDLGILHHEVAGTAAKDPRIKELYRKACDHGSSTGCFSLGMLFETGEDVIANATSAFKLYAKACQGGHGQACYKAALAYRDGRGVIADVYRSQEFLRRACKAGFKKACGK